MRGFVLSGALLLVACGGNHNGQSVCDNVVPAPPACMQACDAQPGAANTCPGGYHCTPDGHCDALCTPAGNECGDGFKCTADGQCQGNDDCDGLECNVVQCQSMNMPSTTVSGKVFAPNGTLPLYGVNVYVPLHPVGDLPAGAVCSKCADTPLGDPLTSDITKEDGSFTLTNVPSGVPVPLVIVSGKWRRIIMIPTVNQCTDNAIDAADTTLPKSMDDMTPNTTSVNMPKLAITTGSADALECLIRRMGIADKEFTIGGGTGRVQLYHGNGASSITGGGNMMEADPWWRSVDSLKTYDAVILSCEGAQNQNTKPQAALDAMKAYADFGGRVFASHWHNIWIEGSTQGGGNQKPSVWPTIAQWNNSGTTFGNEDDLIDEVQNPKGAAFATWMQNVEPASMRDHIAIQNQTGKNTVASLDTTKAEQWTYWPNGGTNLPQNFQFTTPNEVDEGDRCGKVVFSDMHVASGSSSNSGSAFPSGCSTMPLTAQEKALAFMLFDLSSCIGSISKTH
ncbi:MAG: carboxypeptidase regulatory-like domain-containing protein [Kofleriaceae bacterium]